MASSAATTVSDYLASLPPARRAAIARVRDVVNASLPRGYEETMQYGMISWVVPPSRLAETYNGQPLALASLASQKQHMALYLVSVYGDPTLAAWFASAAKAAGKRLDMGKSCVRFTRLDQLPLEVIGEAIRRVSVDAFVAAYHANRARSVKPRPIAARVPSGKRTTPGQRASAAARGAPATRAGATGAAKRATASAAKGRGAGATGAAKRATASAAKGRGGRGSSR